MAAMMFTNSILYFFTWYKLHKDEPRFKSLSGRKASVERGSRRAVKNMTLFVAVFILQWIPLVAKAIWQQSEQQSIPFSFYQCVILFSNIGGILNGIVFFIIKRRTEPRLSPSNEVLKVGNLAIVGYNKTPLEQDCTIINAETTAHSV